ncbi:thioredoxin-like isoform X1 [Saccoglossus kowalevskii]
MVALLAFSSNTYIVPPNPTTYGIPRIGLKAAGNKLVVVDFSAEWCGPCIMIGPKFKEMSETFQNVVFLNIDVDENSETAQSCGVKSMPTFQFYKNGKKIDEFSGASEAKLRETLKKLM